MSRYKKGRKPVQSFLMELVIDIKGIVPTLSELANLS